MRRRPYKRVVYPSQPVDVIDIKFRDDPETREVPRSGQNWDGTHLMSIRVNEFDVYRNGVWVGKFETSERGLIEYAEAMR